MNLGGSIKINKFAVLLLLLSFILIIFYISSTHNKRELAAKSSKTINLRKLLIGAIQAAQAGGNQVLKVSQMQNQEVDIKGKTKEGINDFVTNADLYSHCVIANGLLRIFPKLNLISEEDILTKKCPEHEYFDLDPTVVKSAELPDSVHSVEDISVFVDPLDATKEFTEKLFHYVTVMVCVAVKGEPLIGVIHFPFSDKTYWSWTGTAVSENLKNIKKSEADVKQPVVIVSRSHAGEVKELANKMYGDNVKVLPAAGAGYKVLQVIEGNATVYLHATRIKKWDICSGNAMLAALGGQMINLKGEKITYFADRNDVVVDDGIIAELNKNIVQN